MSANNRFGYYLLFAATFFLFWWLFKIGGMANVLDALVSAATDVILSMIALYITVEILLLKFFYQEKIFLFSFAVSLVILAIGSIVVFSQLYLMDVSLGDYKKNSYKVHYFYWFWSDLVLGSYFLVGFISLGGFAIRLAFDRLTESRKLALIEKERLESQLKNLQNQINPHFLFNALNTIYYKIERNNKPARIFVERFSSLLRYQLYECNTPTVALENELKFVKDYIDLQQERLNVKAFINTEGLGGIQGLEISPYILMPLVENCFKHVSRHDERENIIQLDLCITNNYFSMNTRNTVDENSKANENGIGLKNIRTRLDLVYPGKYTLATTQGNGSFETSFNLLIK